MSIDWVSDFVQGTDSTLFGPVCRWVKYVVVFFFATLISLVLTPLFRELVRHLGMIDSPDVRRINKAPTPRGGGLSVFFAFHLTLLMLIIFFESPISSQFTYSWQLTFFLASTLLAMIGFVDDKQGLKPIVKLSGQIVVASILFFSGISVGGIFVAFPPWLDYCVTVFWMVGVINAFNLIDGMDGLASGLALIASLGLAGSILFVGQAVNMLPYLALAGACLGFLRYNFHPASIFLGDTGSMFLGLCMATLPLMTGSRLELFPAIGVPLLAMGIPLFDTTLAIWRRSVRALLPRPVTEMGKRIQVMQPDKEHVHHRILSRTMNQRTAAWILYGLSSLLVIVGLAGTLLKKRATGVFLIAFLVAMFLIVQHLSRVELWDTGRLLSRKRVTIRRGLIMPCFILFDIAALMVAWLMAYAILELPVTFVTLRSCMSVYVASVFVMLAFFRTYRRVWSRAHFKAFALIFIAVLSGSLLADGIFYLTEKHVEHLIRVTLIFLAFATFFLVGIRLCSESLRGFVYVMRRQVLLQDPKIPRMLAYGGGLRFRSFMREEMAKVESRDRVIVGIVDDDIQFRGRIIYGYDVLGSVDDIPEICAAKRIDGVIITCMMTPEQQKRILELAGQCKLKVLLWEVHERELTVS